MKKVLCILALLAAASFCLSGGTREKVRQVFGSNSGFDDLSRTIEVSISRNPAAAMVFGMENDEAVQVFSPHKVSQ